MRVWFSIIPGHGHFFPVIPLARALAAVGHDVTFCTSASYAKTVRAHGFEAIEVGVDYTQNSVKGDATDPDETARRVIEMMFIDGPPVVFDSLLARFGAARPDVMIVDPIEQGSMVAAEAAGVPWATVMNAVRSPRLPGRLPFDPEERQAVLDRWVDGPMDALRARAGLGPWSGRLGEHLADRTLMLTMAPPSLEAWPSTWTSHTAHPLRPEVHTSDSDDAWLAELADDRPLVSITLGTLFGTPDLYVAAIEAALQEGVRVVAATGFDLGLSHDRLTITPWVSMDRLMERSDAVVHHGGWGSTVAGLATGTPAVVIPLGGDQPWQAARLASVGAAVRIDHRRIAEELPGAIDAVLDDAVYRLNAGRLQSEIEAMPSAVEVVSLVERLAEDGPPILNR